MGGGGHNGLGLVSSHMCRAVSTPLSLIVSPHPRMRRRSGSDLLMHFVDYILKRFEVVTVRPPSATFRILLVDRRFADAGHAVSRAIPLAQMQSITAALRSLQVAERPVEVNVVDFATLSIVQQLKHVRQVSACPVEQCSPRSLACEHPLALHVKS